MIMHGTWYKGPQLTHHSSHSDYHQFRSYPSFVVTPYTAAYDTASGTPVSTQIPANSSFAEGSFTTSVNNQLGVLSPPIKVEQPFGGESGSLAAIDHDEFGPVLNVDCNSIENLFRKPQNTWSTTVSTDGGNNDIINNNNNNSTSLLSPSATNTSTTPEATTHLGLQGNFEDNRRSTPTCSPSNKQRESQVNNCNKGNHNKTDLLAHGLLQQCSSSTMPIGGVQSQNPSQGLVHWMSVMAEHMSGQSHHDPTPVGMHAYMWNGNVDCVQHGKDIGDYNGWTTTSARSHMSVAAIKQGYEVHFVAKNLDEDSI